MRKKLRKKQEQNGSSGGGSRGLAIVGIVCCALLVFQNRNQTYLKEGFRASRSIKAAAVVSNYTVPYSPIVPPVAPLLQTPPAQCSADDLAKIQEQLPPDRCLANKRQPWTSDCSFSAASSCPDTTPWLHHHFLRPQQQQQQQQEDPFLSFFVGCNKAIDAVTALRMGSRNNPRFNVSKWKKALGDPAQFAGSSCAQFEREEPFTTATPPTNISYRPAQVFCFEPVSATFAQLQHAKLQMGWSNELVLEEAAVSKSPGSMAVLRDTPLGQENQGLHQLGDACASSGNCRKIPIYTLDDYVGSLPRKPHIHVLSIDVEGYDFEVLKGAAKVLKTQVQYLEFEYNWKGPWEKQNLQDAMDYLSDLGFVCYWPGKVNGHLWRITGCWQDYYAFHYWANVACVNYNIPEAQPLAQEMERLFQATIHSTDTIVYQKGDTPTPK